MKLSKYKLLTILFLLRRWNVDSPARLLSDKHFLSALLGPNYSQTLSRLKAQGLILSAEEKPDGFLPSTRRVGESADSLQITYRGVNDLLLRFPLLDYLDKSWFDGVYPEVSREANHAWDEKLTCVIFNISETKRKDRDRLRYNLKTLGFGRLNRSLYLSPHLSVKEVGHLLSQSLGLDPLGSNPSKAKTFAFSVPFDSFKSAEDLSDFWEIDKVGDLYERALASWAADSPTRRVDGKNPSGFSSAARFLSKFIEALLVDPLLPAPLLPKSWVGTAALEIAKMIIAG